MIRMLGVVIRCAGIGTTLVLAGCLMKSAIWVVEGSTSDHVEFGISDKRHGSRAIEWGVLTIWECPRQDRAPQHTLWTLTRETRFWKDEWPVRIVYGAPPAGFKSDKGPEALVPGCYEAVTSGTGSVRFVIDSIGSVVELQQE